MENILKKENIKTNGFWYFYDVLGFCLEVNADKTHDYAIVRKLENNRIMTNALKKYLSRHLQALHVYAGQQI